MDNLQVGVQAAAVISAAPQFADEWGDTPGGPVDGPEMAESPRQEEKPIEEAPIEPRRESLRKEKPMNLNVPEPSMEIKSPRLMNNQAIMKQKL